MGGLSWWHWLIIGAAFILLFGAKKLPDAARGLGRSLRILKSEIGAMNEEDHKLENDQGNPAGRKLDAGHLAVPPVQGEFSSRSA